MRTSRSAPARSGAPPACSQRVARARGEVPGDVASGCGGAEMSRCIMRLSGFSNKQETRMRGQVPAGRAWGRPAGSKKRLPDRRPAG